MEGKTVSMLTPNDLRGGISARILSVAATLAAVGFFVIFLLAKKGEDQKFHYANALTIAEYGLGEALMKLGGNSVWREGFKAMEYNHGSYTVTLSSRNIEATLFLTVESVGESGSAQRKKTVVLKMQVSPQGDSIWTQHSAR